MTAETDSGIRRDNDRTGVPARPPVRRLASEALLAGAREIEIDHYGQTYRLRRTNRGKLILTK